MTKSIYLLYVYNIMPSQRLSITLPEDVVTILKSKRNRSGFIADSIREKEINDKRKNIRIAANRLLEYYDKEKNLHIFKELETDDFLE